MQMYMYENNRHTNKIFCMYSVLFLSLPPPPPPPPPPFLSLFLPLSPSILSLSLPSSLPPSTLSLSLSSSPLSLLLFYFIPLYLFPPPSLSIPTPFLSTLLLLFFSFPFNNTCYTCQHLQVHVHVVARQHQAPSELYSPSRRPISYCISICTLHSLLCFAR